MIYRVHALGFTRFTKVERLARLTDVTVASNIVREAPVARDSFVYSLSPIDDGRVKGSVARLGYAEKQVRRIMEGRHRRRCIIL
jgi:hypothetical protein